MSALSSNHYSHDQQVSDVLDFLLKDDRELEEEFTRQFPEYTFLTWGGGGDAHASNVDPEYMQWITEWIEANTDVYWEDGEPWYDEPYTLSLIIPFKAEPVDIGEPPF